MITQSPPKSTETYRHVPPPIKHMPEIKPAISTRPNPLDKNKTRTHSSHKPAANIEANKVLITHSQGTVAPYATGNLHNSRSKSAKHSTIQRLRRYFSLSLSQTRFSTPQPPFPSRWTRAECDAVRHEPLTTTEAPVVATLFSATRLQGEYFLKPTDPQSSHRQSIHSRFAHRSVAADSDPFSRFSER